MKKGERLELIRQIAPLLADLDWHEIHLTLRPFNQSWSDNPEATVGGKLAYATSMLENSQDDDLVEPQEYLKRRLNLPSGTVGEGGWEPCRFRLFLSHDTRDKKVVAELKTSLSDYAVDCFVAHEHIMPTTQWLTEIDTALGTCDA